MLGNKPGMCSSPGSGHDPSAPEFGVGYDMTSQTDETSWIAGKWKGEDGNPCVTLIDTPGAGDTEGRDCQHAKKIFQVVRNIGEIHAFVLMLKGTDNRFSGPIKEQILLYQDIFGKSFWKKLIVEVGWWSHDRKSIQKRIKNQKVDEAKRKTELNQRLQELAGGIREIPVVFVDPVYDWEYAESNETEIFNNETAKLWDFVNLIEPYKCLEKSCTEESFVDGEPLLISANETSVRVGGKITLQFRIWFGECGEHKRVRNYHINFRNSTHSKTIFTMVDNQGIESNNQPPHPQKLEGFPPSAEIQDQCSFQNDDHSCDNDKSKYKEIFISFSSIQEDSFGSFSIGSYRSYFPSKYNIFSSK